MRTIERMPDQLARLLFEAGPRTPVLVESETQRDTLHQQFRSRLSDLEFFAPEDNETIESLLNEGARFSRKNGRFGMTYREFCQSSEEAFQHTLADRQIPGKVEERDAEDTGGDIDEVFIMPPVPTKQVKIRIHKSEPAPFYFVDDEYIPDDSDF